MRSRWILGGVLVAAFAALSALPILAHCGKCTDSAKQIASMLDAGKMSLGKAIEAAEKESKGRAVGVYCDVKKDALGISCYCMVGDKLMQVDVDGKTGKVTGSKESKSIGHHDDDDKKGSGSGK